MNLTSIPASNAFRQPIFRELRIVQSADSPMTVVVHYAQQIVIDGQVVSETMLDPIHFSGPELESRPEFAALYEPLRNFARVALSTRHPGFVSSP